MLPLTCTQQLSSYISTLHVVAVRLNGIIREPQIVWELNLADLIVYVQVWGRCSDLPRALQITLETRLTEGSSLCRWGRQPRDNGSSN